MKESTAIELLNKVQKDYAAIAEDFSETRKWLWPEFTYFKKYLKPGQNILDLGCGNGRLYEFVRDSQNVKYIGIDNNKKFVQIAQKNYSSAKFMYGDLLKLDEKLLGNQIDLLFSIASFHHIPSKMMRTKSIQEIKKVLKKNGILIITVWNIFQKRYRKYILKSLYNYFIQQGKYDWNDTFIPWSDSGIDRYYHAFTPRELKKLFENNGFEILEMFYTRKDKKTSFWKAFNINLVCQKK